MDWSNATTWWVVGGILVAVELVTGTFYLLMLAVGAVAAALASHLGVSVSTQLITAALVGGGATLAWHFKRKREPVALPAAQNRDVNLDIGEHVTVDAWTDDSIASVRYRGSQWVARRSPGAPVATGLHRVTAVEGNHLVLEPLPRSTSTVPSASPTPTAPSATH